MNNVHDAVDEIINEWDDVKTWVAAPRVAAYIQNLIDNNVFEMHSEAAYLNDSYVR